MTLKRIVPFQSANPPAPPAGYGEFLLEIKSQIRQRQFQALRAANRELLALYWWLGENISQRQLAQGWGKSVVENLARDLQAEFPGRNGFSARNLWNMLDFYRDYVDRPKLQLLVAEISWAKNLVILARCKDDLEREFYLRATARFGWTKSVLQHQLDNHSYPRLQSVAKRITPQHFTTEVKPVFDVLELDIRTAAKELQLSEEVKSMATRAALNLLTEREVRTELFSGESSEESVQVVTDRTALMQRTQTALEKMGLEEQDHIDLIGELARQLLPEIERAHAYRENAAPAPAGALRAQARDAACWVIHKQLPELQEALHAQWASKAREAPAQALPDALLMPTGKALLPSRKNIYGVLFPETDSVAQAAGALPLAAQTLFKNEMYAFAQDTGGKPSGDMFSTARLDATFEFNTQELAFAQSLDRADFVAWWHRNPQGKPYSIALMRTDSQNNS